MTQGAETTAYRIPGARRALPTLDDVRVATPCTVDWDSMVGNGRVRSCLECDKQVFNISSMNRANAEALLADHIEGVCIRFYRRFDGTILTADCPVGVKARARLRATWGAMVAAVLAGLSLIGLRALGSTVNTKVGVATMGAVCTMPPPDQSR